jgi:cytochrome c peroxidase
MVPDLGERRGRTSLACLVATAALAGTGCGGTAGDTGTNVGGAASGNELTALAALGKKIFRDESLSGSGRMSCATCHDPAHAFAQPTSDPVPLGGASLDQAGLRNAPSLEYARYTPAFHFASDGTPTGGFDRDGRAADLAAQAEGPFLTVFEMANASAADVVAKLSRASYAADFQAVFGAGAFDDADQAFLEARQALEAYELEAPELAPFSSKYDYFLAGRVQLSAAEMRGLALYNDPRKGNCGACHPSTRSADGTPPLFTDFTYDDLGVPRNAAIPANSDPTYFDLGLCGPLRTDLAVRTDLCGAFKVPTLRNIALTAPYFHNGRFQTLRDALGFYVRRDTSPEEFYPLGADGLVRKFDDLPPEYVRNVNTTEVPYNRHPGDLPALSADEIDDVIAFLQTLTDGYTT